MLQLGRRSIVHFRQREGVCGLEFERQAELVWLFEKVNQTSCEQMVNK